MDFLLHLYELGLCECGLVLGWYVDLLFNIIEQILCVCGFVSGCGFVLYVDFIDKFEMGLKKKSHKYSYIKHSLEADKNLSLKVQAFNNIRENSSLKARTLRGGKGQSDAKSYS